jgi:hypothetical protein
LAVAWAALALAPASVFAASTPTITSISPNELGSGGNVKVTIKGTNFEHIATKGVRYGLDPLKRITSGTPVRDQFKVKPGSINEIEMIPPFHERGQVVVQVCTEGQPGEEVCSPAAAEPANTMTLTPELFVNEFIKNTGTFHEPVFAYGELELESPQTDTQIECVNVGFGGGWNEAPTGQPNPVSARGEILEWSASGHSPAEAHPELGNRCRFVYEGSEEVGAGAPVAWASAEAPLEEVTDEAALCRETKALDVECPTTEREAEFVHETVIRSLSRGALMLPWNVQYTERAGAQRMRIGAPDECKGRSGTERTELGRCPQASEREAAASSEACTAGGGQDPPGCVSIQIIAEPPLNVDLVYQGYVEPKWINGVGNGLSPSEWEFEGSGAGEPALHLANSPATEGSITGMVKLIGAAGRELLTVK